MENRERPIFGQKIGRSHAQIRKLGNTVISLYVNLSNSVHSSSVKQVLVLKVADALHDDNRHLPKIRLRPKKLKCPANLAVELQGLYFSGNFTRAIG